MLLKAKENGDLVKVVNLEDLLNPNKSEISGCGQSGQEEQPATAYQKENLIFPSGEELPVCWKDANYTKG